MDIDPGLTGLELKEYATVVDWRKTTNYAAAIGDGNPVYFDDERPGGIVGHPMFPVALTWPLSSNPGAFIQKEKLSGDVLARQVHYSETLEIFRLTRPGDRLVIRGTVAAILPHRAGTHLVIRYDAVDEEQKPVFREWIGAMLRGVDCIGQGRSIGLPPEPDSDLSETSSRRCSEITVDPLFSYVYDGCTDIVFPIHTSPAFARLVGLPGIIVQGTATLALAVKDIVNREAAGDPTRVRAIQCRFGGMVQPGETIKIEVSAGTGGRVFFQVLNGRGEKAIRRGVVSLG